MSEQTHTQERCQSCGEQNFAAKGATQFRCWNCGDLTRVGEVVTNGISPKDMLLLRQTQETQ